MNTIRYEDADQDWEGDFDDELPARPRRRFLNWWSAALMALILGGIGFYAGIRVEKNQLSSSSGTGGSLASALASRVGASGAGRSGASAGSFASRFGGGGGLFGGGGGAAGGASVGTVSSVDGNTIYVTDTSGNTIKVKLSSATTISKSENVSKAKVYPGDTVVVSGVKGSGGTLTATTLTDAGSRGGGSGTGSSSTTGSSGSSAVRSLFGGG